MLCTEKLTKRNLWLNIFFKINSRRYYFRKLTLFYHACPKCAIPHSKTHVWQPPHWLPAWRRGTRPVSVLLLSSTPYCVVQCCAIGRHYGLVPFFFPQIIVLITSPGHHALLFQDLILGVTHSQVVRIFFYCRWHGCIDRAGRATLFSEEELWDVSRMRLGEEFVEFMFGCTICRLGNTVGRLPFFPSSELEITTILRHHTPHRLFLLIIDFKSVYRCLDSARCSCSGLSQNIFREFLRWPLRVMMPASFLLFMRTIILHPLQVL
jgi:hypothetical protein